MNDNNGNGEPVEILLVEDTETFCQLVIRTLAKAKTKFNVTIAKDGIEALECLRKEGKYCDAPKPDLILLDINMPRMDGHQVLQKIKQDLKYRVIPVIMMTASSSKEDIDKSYHHQANLYITKPLRMADFEETMETIEDFWTSNAALPDR